MLERILSLLIFSIIVGLIIILIMLLKKNHHIAWLDKTIKILSIVYFTMCFVNLVLPDSYIISTQNNQEILANRDIMQNILRWGNYMSVVVLPIAIFFDNRILRKIAIYFCLPFTILNCIFIFDYLQYFVSETGRGLNMIFWLPQELKNLLINEKFRIIYFGLMQVIALLIPLYLLIFKKHRFNFKDLKEWESFLIVLGLLMILFVPIYIPQMIFGLIDIKFTKFGLIHFGWIGIIIIEIIALIKIFKNKSQETKLILCLILAVNILFQFNSMFALTINIKKLPLQLCNLASYLIFISLITKNRHIFNFNFIVNVVGAFLAIMFPDITGTSLVGFWNMHFITEHTHILVVPILCLAFNIFPKIDKMSLKDYFIGFTIYFVFCFIVGTILNGIANKQENDYFQVNYFFMFDMKKVVETIPFLEPLTKVIVDVGIFKIYPAIQMFIYFGYNLLCFGFYEIVKLCYYLKEKNSLRKLAV